MGRGLVECGHEVTVIASARERSVQNEDGMQVIQAPLGNLHWYLHRLKAPSLGVLPVRELEWSWSLRQEVERVRRDRPIDVIEGQETGVLFLGGTGRGQPLLIVRLHGDQQTFAKYSGQPVTLGHRLDRLLQARAWSRAAAVTAPSDSQASEMATQLGWDVGRIQVIPNPIDPWMLERATESIDVPNDYADGKVLYVGRIEFRKGTLSLLQSVPIVAQSVPTVEYLIAGARHSSIGETTLQRHLDLDRTRDHVRLLGHIPWHDLPALYREAQVFVMPSYYETFGISVVEAMAFGLPVVASRAGGLSGVVMDGETGILVAPGDPRALAEATTRLLADAKLRLRMGMAGRERVLAKFTLDQVLTSTLQAYDRVLGGRQRDGS
jgi:glycosyltransferase involved in cell wall biosynthesis